MNNVSPPKKEDSLTYSIILTNQKKLILTGIQEVYSTNDKMLCLKSGGKKLVVTGEKINITKLIVESGELEADGVFDSIKYANSSSGNIFKRMFK